MTRFIILLLFYFINVYKIFKEIKEVNTILITAWRLACSSVLMNPTQDEAEFPLDHVTEVNVMREWSVHCAMQCDQRVIQARDYLTTS